MAGSDVTGHNYVIPRVWWLLFAVAQFAAHTLDGCDGKQARRTNSRYISLYKIAGLTNFFAPSMTNDLLLNSPQ